MHVEQSPERLTQRIRAARQSGSTIGVVPTMGALHAGHLSLVEAARAECDLVVATIFVNPTQFGPNEDFQKYPRTLESDLELCRAAGSDLVFTPATDSMYPPGAQTVVSVGQIAAQLEGACRPGHFDGVTTIVAKLFNVTLPDRAYFGQKDFQQQLVIRQMVQDLNFPLTIVTCPIVREADGLAMSSRNRYLSTSERKTATALFHALQKTSESAAARQRESVDIDALTAELETHLRGTPGIELEYAVIVDADTLGTFTADSETAVALVAAKVGATRLIDNLILQFR
jgi:pantoate--beta-alanine ligase